MKLPHMQSWLTANAWLALFIGQLAFSNFAAAADASIIICSKDMVTMPSIEQHRAWLTENKRYGSELAAEFVAEARASGDDYLQYQIIYQPELSGSLFFDLQGLSGLLEAKPRPFRKSICDAKKYYPLVILIGLELKSTSRGVLYVSRRIGLVTLISLGRLRNTHKAVPVRIFRSNTLLCPDLKDDYSSEIGCSHPSQYFKQNERGYTK